MLNYIKNTLVLISLSILVSCGSYTKSTIKYINPSKEIDKATLCIYRVDSFVGSFFPTTVYLDGNKLCVLHMKGYIVTNVVPGPHEIIVPDAAILDPKYPMYNNQLPILRQMKSYI